MVGSVTGPTNNFSLKRASRELISNGSVISPFGGIGVTSTAASRQNKRPKVVGSVSVISIVNLALLSE